MVNLSIKQRIPHLENGDRLTRYEFDVWQIFENKLDWFSLQQGEYVSLEVDADGVIKSQVFPGLWLSMSDLIAGNMQQVLAVLQLGLNSPEHQSFLQQLSSQNSGVRIVKESGKYLCFGISLFFEG